MVTFEDFSKIELKIATVLSAERVEESNKLLQLTLDLGSEKRQIIAGIAKSYTPEKIIGKQIVVVANLEPKTIMGLVSQGMVLAAHGDSPIILMPERPVTAGSNIS